MYSIFDIALDSDVPLPELPEVATANTIIRVTNGTGINTIPSQIEWFHHWQTPEGEICISCARLADSIILRFPEAADFIVSLSANSVQYFPAPNVPMETIRHLLLDQLIPRILGQQNRLVIHASAVVLPNGKAVAFIGHSGYGKSTLASYFCRQGAQLMSDDCLLLESHKNKLIAIPNYYGVRLFEDSIKAIFSLQHQVSSVAHYSAKKRLFPHDKQVTRLPAANRIDAIFLLGKPGNNRQADDVVIQSIKGANELMALIEQLFILDVSDRHMMKRQFQNFGKLVATRTPIYKLEFPHKHALLPVVKARVDNIVKQ